jgi:hypothetical protein
MSEIGGLKRPPSLGIGGQEDNAPRSSQGAASRPRANDANRVDRQHPAVADPSAQAIGPPQAPRTGRERGSVAADSGPPPALVATAAGSSEALGSELALWCCCGL